MKRADAAVAAHKEGFNCSQAVFAAFAEDLGLERALALKIAAGFGGGMGRTAGVCGAVTGACMALGLKHGAAKAGDREAKERSYAQVREFLGRFAARYGSSECRTLLGCDIGGAEGHEEAKQKRLFTTLCPGFVRGAAEILEEMGV